MYTKYLLSVIGLSIMCLAHAAGDEAHPVANALKGPQAVAPGMVQMQTPRGGDIHVTPASTTVSPGREPSSGWYVVNTPAPSSKPESAEVGVTGETLKAGIKQQAEMWHEPPPLPPLPPYPSATDTQEVEPVTGTTLFNGENMIYVPLGQTLRYKAQTQHE